MSQLVPRQLSARVFPYLREYLDLMAQMHTWERVTTVDGEERFLFPNRPDRLLPSLLHARNREAGRVWTFLPATMSDAAVEQLTGHEWLDHDLSGQGYERQENSVVAYVRGYLRRSQAACGIFDPQETVPRFPLPDGGLLLGEEIYIHLSHDRSSEQAVTEALRAGGYWHYGILFNGALFSPPQTRTTITQDALRLAVDNIHCAIFSAFDDTGYIIWEPLAVREGRDVT